MAPWRERVYGSSIGWARVLPLPELQLQTTLWQGVAVKRWYHPNHFLPREIQHDPIWQRLTESDKMVYRFVCEHSYLTSRSPTRRYCEWTYEQIGQHVGLSRRQVLRIMQKLMKARLIYRWYIGDSGSNTIDGRPRPPRYEIPASRGMIGWWRRIRNLRKKKPHNRKEASYEKKGNDPCPDLPPVPPRNGFHRRC